MSYPKPYNMDHCYYKIRRRGTEQRVCFSDLTYQEREQVLANHDKESLIRLACHLGECLHNAGASTAILRALVSNKTDEEE